MSGAECTAIISSCQVNLRDPETKQLLGKEWRVESTSATFAQRIHCPCPTTECRKKHAPSLGKNLRSTAYYSPEFARRVVHHVLRDEQFVPDKASVAARRRQLQEIQDINLQECQCHRFRPSGPGLLCSKCLGFETSRRDASKAVAAVRAQKDSELPPFTKVEVERVQKQLSHLHRATGHGSYEGLIKSLEHRQGSQSPCPCKRIPLCNL